MTITWDQVRAWRLQRQFLDPRGSADAVEVSEETTNVESRSDLACYLMPASTLLKSVITICSTQPTP